MSIAHKITDTESNRPSIIHILGASGGGTTTLGRALAERFGYTLLDTDDFFWLPTDPKYTTPRPVDERRRLLEEAVNAAPRCVISGSMTSWGDIFRSLDFVIVVETPTPVRIERLLQREFAHFGGASSPAVTCIRTIRNSLHGLPDTTQRDLNKEAGRCMKRGFRRSPVRLLR